MKKLFYSLFLCLFFIVSCSDDDKEFFTRDADYDIRMQVMEYNYPNLQNMIYVIVGGNWHVEGYYYEPQIAYNISQGTLHISCGKLEYTKRPEGITNCGFTMPAPQVHLPANVSKIVVTRKEVEDVYLVEQVDNMITLTPQQTSFSEFEFLKYQSRPENTFVARFSEGIELHDQFFEFMTAAVSLTRYNYDSTIEPLWYVMKGYNNPMPLYRYENKDDYEKIIELFNIFCDEHSKTYAYLESWKGEMHEYTMSRQ